MSVTSGGTAVMARRLEPPNSLDFFPTPPWATRALCEFLLGRGFELPGLTAYEPACGEGDMVGPLQEYFRAVYASDIHDYGARFPMGARVLDFTDNGLLGGAEAKSVDWVITNPPFNSAEAFLERGFEVARGGVAILIRAAWAEGEKRYRTIFSKRPPAFELQFASRVVMARGRLRDPDLKFRDPNTGEIKTPSTATAYSWFVWDQNCQRHETIKAWIGPCRRELTRPGDYPPLPEGERIDRSSLLDVDQNIKAALREVVRHTNTGPL